MSNLGGFDRVRIVAARVVDLRSEFEAQLRAAARLEAHLQESDRGDHASMRTLEDAVRRELSGMLTNNTNIRTVLKELGKDVQTA